MDASLTSLTFITSLTRNGVFLCVWVVFSISSLDSVVTNHLDLKAE